MKKMMTAALALGAITVSGSAFAQFENFDPTPYGFSFRAGVAFPTADELKGNDDTFIALGVDFNLNGSVLRRGESFISLDYISADFGGEGGALFPIMLNNRFYTSQDAMANRTYIVGGVGIIRADLDKDGTGFGARLGLGMEMGPNVFLEGVYTFGRKIKDVSPNVFTISLGYRF